MELTITNVVFLLAGVLALAVSILLYLYFNGGTGANVSSLLGLIGRYL